jgi:beta-phosphoglucomutase
MRVPAAILFDFDGVIVDSERLHCEAMAEAMAGEGPVFGWDYYREHLMGLDDRGAFARLLERGGLGASPDGIRRLIERKAALFARYAREGRVPAFPGATGFVRACAAAGPVGLCSGALRSDIDPVLAGLGIAECFAEKVTADDVERSKPDPASYRLCVARMAARFPEAGIVPETCVAIEDTADGIASARGAGLAVLGVATHLAPAALLAAGAAAAVESLDGLDPAIFSGLLPSAS